MRMIDLMESKEPNGTYVAVKFDEDTQNALVEFAKEAGIPDALNKSEFHSTIVYSRKHLPDYEVLGTIDEPWEAKPKEFTVWEKKPNAYDDRHTYCLVMQLTCPKMNERHTMAREDHGATYDFDEYLPHVTLSYDVGVGFDVKKLKWTGDPLKVVKEYKEDLKDD